MRRLPAPAPARETFFEGNFAPASGSRVKKSEGKFPARFGSRMIKVTVPGIVFPLHPFFLSSCFCGIFALRRNQPYINYPCSGDGYCILQGKDMWYIIDEEGNLVL